VVNAGLERLCSAVRSIPGNAERTRREGEGGIGSVLECLGGVLGRAADADEEVDMPASGDSYPESVRLAEPTLVVCSRRGA
jgi:hypothetical protein